MNNILSLTYATSYLKDGRLVSYVGEILSSYQAFGARLLIEPQLTADPTFLIRSLQNYDLAYSLSK